MNNALPEVAALSQATTTQRALEEAPTLEAFLQEEGSGSECQAAVQTVGLPASLFTYNHDGVLILQAPLDGALQKYVPVTLRTHILYF